MSWYALSALGDARDATKSLLVPVDRGRWLRLALIAFFVGGVGGGGGGGGGQSVNVSNGDFSGQFPGGIPTGELPPVQSIAAVVAALVLVVLLVALILVAIGSVMEFVFVEGVRTRDVRIRGPFRTYLRPGLRVFGFRVLAGLGIFLLVALPIAGIVLAGVTLSPALLLLAIPIAILVGIVGLVVGVVLQLTVDFVVPAMLAEDRGVLDGWRRLWPILRREWEQAALYVLVRYALGIAAAIAVGLVVVLLALVVALPFLLVGGLLYALLVALGGPGLAGWLALGFVGLLYGLAVVIVSLFVQVPVVTYFRYYALFVLGEFDEGLDLVATFRATDESENGDGASPAAAG
ncbi:hypothetical protein SAMN04487949_1282 [Halogranum gelatinilyticum]|uniref:Membrane domain of glycerophosphoryl diester phosphodiesterase n=1 Tax=Halogranum gelatinilyticum TaxID=660521 RepID=A0A1G9RDI4_9EURY|nr:hypothetical protein [Halogranum gelatinilyticum]SDM20907.1 hypothetical protein SAMN04487949_1282 [Halogranum gelatinilyticum]